MLFGPSQEKSQGPCQHLEGKIPLIDSEASKGFAFNNARYRICLPLGERGRGIFPRPRISHASPVLAVLVT